MKKRFKNKFVLLKFLALGLLILLIFLTKIGYKKYTDRQAVEREKNELIAQTAALEKNNSGLKESIKFLEASGFKEKVAREQLNLKKKGEEAYFFSEELSEPIEQNSGNMPKKTNFQKWLEYFYPNPEA